MKIACDKCGEIIDRDKYIGETLVEAYNNVYGTRCLFCGNMITSIVKKTIPNEDTKLKMEILKEEMREKMRKKILKQNKKYR